MLCLVVTSTASDPLDDLKSLLWKNRIILIKLNRESEKLLETFKNNKAAIDDRDLLWFVYHRKGIETNYTGQLSPEFGTTVFPQQSKVTLIGKDGASKLHANSLDLKQIFALIDTMPMRRNEISN